MPQTIVQQTYADAINDALKVAMDIDPGVIVYGLGVDDPKRIFGTTADLRELYGGERVFDMPTSENAMTGVAIGASLKGIRPVMVHQRMDFFLLAMDQLINGAAKWRFMFGGKNSIPITIRLVIGRGWGQGPTHSQSLQSWFAHVPGLKVVMPSSAQDAKGLLLSSIFDDNPVLFMEHRWLHQQLGEVTEGDFRVPIGKASKIRSGNDATVVSLSLMTVESIQAVEFLVNYGISCDLIDLRSVRPIDWDTVERSVEKTGRLLVIDPAHPTCSVASEIIAGVTKRQFDKLIKAPRSITFPDIPVATSRALSEEYYPSSVTIAQEIADMMERNIDLTLLTDDGSGPKDVPGPWFTGPF